MPGLIVSDPAHDAGLRAACVRLLHDYDLPFAGFTDAPAADFPPSMPRNAFLRAASIAALLGRPIPLESLHAHIPGHPLPANVLRRHLFLRLSLTPYLRPGRAITPLEGCFRLGDDLLVVPVSPEDTVDAQLPPGIWTELNGACHEGRLRGMRGWNETPVLARANALIPISMNGQSLTQTASDDADRLTLHWFQPEDAAECTLADGTTYHVQRRNGHISIDANTEKACHLIAHQDGIETLIG